MKLEHAALYVENLEAAKDFFITYFGAKANGKYHNKTTGFESYFLKFEPKDGRSAGAPMEGQAAAEPGARLEIMTRPDLAPCDNLQNRRGFIHLAFSTGSKEAVDTLTERLKKDGYAVLSGPRTTGDGYYESCIAGIEGNQIEITV